MGGTGENAADLQQLWQKGYRDVSVPAGHTPLNRDNAPSGVTPHALQQAWPPHTGR